MREILFKAKRKEWRTLPKEQWWVEGYYLNIAEINHFICTGKIKLNGAIKGIIAPEMYAIDINTLCQYTGLTDKSNRKIWENDIVSNEWCFLRGKSIVKFGEYKDSHMPERYQCGNYGFFLEHMHQNDFGARKDILYFSCKCEVVGNIFDDKELLEVE